MKPAQNLLDSVSEEDLAKLRAYQAETSSHYKVDNEWLLLAEWAMTFGWQAYLDVKHDNRANVTGEEMMTLIEASRKIKEAQHYRAAESSFIGAGAAQAGKKAYSTFKKMTKAIIKRSKADEE
jgi:hypothetical protein